MKGQGLKYALIILIPLVLSAYTHIWNLLGFPSFHIDEAHYLRRVMLVLSGMGPQESAANGYPRTYDHPYFGQLFVAGILRLSAFPDSLTQGDTYSIETLHLVPRLVMGFLAILDTFIIFKIVERRYSLILALIAGLLFAAMPSTWMFRRIYLEAIMMPFLLSSILVALYLREPKNSNSLQPKSNYTVNKYVLVLLSGILLGLSIYTKIPAFTMIPLVGTIVFFYSGKSLRSVGIWLIPVIGLPLLWLLYSVVVGQTDLWTYWLLWQTEREDRPLSLSIANLFSIDPLLVTIGIAGVVFATIRKDFFPLLWMLPFLIFSYFVGWVQYFHLMLIIPVFCISSAILLGSIQRFVGKYYHLLSYSIVGAIVIFGIVSTTLLITLDVNSDYYKIYAAVVEKIPSEAEQQDGKITLIGSHWWVWDTYWIAQYILDKPYYWIDPHLDSKFKDKILTEKVLIVGDPIFVNSLSRRIDSDNLRQIRSLYNESSVLTTFYDNVTSQTKGYYPYNTLPIMIWNENHPTGNVTLKSNY